MIPAVVVALLLGAAGFLLVGEPTAPPPSETEQLASRVRRGPSEPVPRAPALLSPPSTTTAASLQTLAELVDRPLVACEVPHWLEAHHYGALRPGWVKDGVVHLLVAPGESQRAIYATPQRSLSYTVEDVRHAATDPELRAAILAEARARPNPKEAAPELVGLIRWATADPGAVGRCAIHPPSDRVSLTVYVEDAQARLVDAYVRAGDNGMRTAGGAAILDVVEGQPIRVTASSGAGSAALRVTPGDGTEVILTLEDKELPGSDGLIDWDAALVQANSGADPETRAVLAEFEQFVRHGERDELQEALADLAADGPKPQEKPRWSHDKGTTPLLVPLTP